MNTAIASASGVSSRCSMICRCGYVFLNSRAVLPINGSAIAAYEPIAQAARDRGWEFIGHGFSQKNMQKVPDEREDIVKTTDAIRAFTGRPPRGWLGPGL